MLSQNTQTNPQVLTHSADLEKAAMTWAKSSMLAVDTEFVRERTFYPRLALIQISDGKLTGLVDPIALKDLAPFIELIESRSIIKVFHSASEDIETLFHHFGTVPRPILDTQVAAAFCGFGLAVGYQALVEEVLGTRLHKGETRSDWLARPLSAAQIAYAADDVEPLYRLAHALQDRLRELDRLDWAREESEMLLDVERFDANLDGALHRIRGRRQLAPRQLEALRRLVAWREEEARRRDIPRNFVVRSNALLKLARDQPDSIEGLGRIEGIGKRSLKRYGDTWMDLLHQARGVPRESLPKRQVPVPLQRRRQVENAVRQVVARVASNLDLPAPLVASRRMIEELATVLVHDHPELPAHFNGWRREVLGDQLMSQLHSVGVRL